MKAKKHFGQNFLIDNEVLEKISNSVFATEKDLIIEIGPGKGALTNKLLEKNSQVIAYEIDKDLVPVLNKINNKNLIIKNIDFLKTEINKDLVKYDYEELYIVGNLPYYITTPILEHIIKNKIKHKSLTIMVQLEVANRFLSKPKNKEYGYFTVYLQHFYDIEKITNVKSTSFDPMPKVESAVIRLIPKEGIKKMNQEYFEFIKDCFKEKRKTLKNNLKNYNIKDLEEILKSHDLSPLARAEELNEEVFVKIYENSRKTL